MFDKDRWNEILEAMNANRFRTFMTAFGVFWGITILVLLLALTTGLSNGVKKDFGDFATNSMFTWTQGTSMSYKGLPKGRRLNYKLADVEILREEFPQLKYISPRNQLGGFRGSNNVIRGTKTGAFNVYGDYPEYINQASLEITAGRWINYGDINEKRKVAVIGKAVQTGLYDKGEDPLGTFVKINGVNFKVIGVYNVPRSQGDAEQETSELYIPFTTFSQAFNMGDTVGWMAITAVDEVPITDIKEDVFTRLRELRTIHPQDKRALGHFDLAEQFSKITGLFDVMAFVGYFVGGLVLFSGAIGIGNIMLIVVKERTQEIGVRRALGATPWSIKSQVLMESLTLTIVSGLAGIAFASLVIYIMNTILDSVGEVPNFANPSVTVSVIIIALIILIISGLLAGLLPATRATQMKPVDALRTE